MHTHLTRSEVLDRLQNNTAGPRPFLWPGLSIDGRFRYCGTLTKTSFRIWQLQKLIMISYRPVIDGEIKPTKGGADIEIRTHIHISILAGALVWLIFAGWLLFDTIASSLVNPATSPYPENSIWLVLGLVLFIIIILCIPFEIESQQETQYLLRLFEARQIR